MKRILAIFLVFFLFCFQPSDAGFLYLIRGIFLQFCLYYPCCAEPADRCLCVSVSVSDGAVSTNKKAHRKVCFLRWRRERALQKFVCRSNFSILAEKVLKKYKKLLKSKGKCATIKKEILTLYLLPLQQKHIKTRIEVNL